MNHLTSTSAQRVVVVAITGAAVIAAARAIHDGEQPRLRVAIGAFLAAGVLAMLADLAPLAAAMLAFIVLLGSAFTAGTLFDSLADLTKLGPAAAAPAAPGSSQTDKLGPPFS